MPPPSVASADSVAARGRRGGVSGLSAQDLELVGGEILPVVGVPCHPAERPHAQEIQGRAATDRRFLAHAPSDAVGVDVAPLAGAGRQRDEAKDVRHRSRGRGAPALGASLGPRKLCLRGAGGTGRGIIHQVHLTA